MVCVFQTSFCSSWSTFIDFNTRFWIGVTMFKSFLTPFYAFSGEVCLSQMDYNRDYKTVTRHTQISAYVRNIRRLSLKSAYVRTYARGGGDASITSRVRNARYLHVILRLKSSHDKVFQSWYSFVRLGGHIFCLDILLLLTSLFKLLAKNKSHWQGITYQKGK